MSHFSKGDLIIVFCGMQYNGPYLVCGYEVVGPKLNEHVSNIDILYYDPAGAISNICRVDEFHIFHAQYCEFEYCKKHLKQYKKIMLY